MPRRLLCPGFYGVTIKRNHSQHTNVPHIIVTNNVSPHIVALGSQIKKLHIVERTSSMVVFQRPVGAGPDVSIWWLFFFGVPHSAICSCSSHNLSGFRILTGYDSSSVCLAL